MLARIVENWLTNAGELGYQTAFAQLLISEGYRLLHAPVHHPYEHGKDIAAISPDGALHAFQLKGGEIGLSDLEKIQGQLFALAGTAIDYPGIDPPRSPDRVFLVTNGDLTAPARDRLRAFNEANRQRAFPLIETVERDQLVGRLVAAQGAYLPSELEDLNVLLRLVLADGRSPFPVRSFAQMLDRVIEPSQGGRSARDTKRAVSSATILTSYGTGPWQRAANHLAVAEGWLTLAFAILRTAELQDLREEDWLISFELARDSARSELGELVSEAAAAQDLVIPDIVDGLVYPARAVLTCGYVAAFFLSEHEFGDSSPLRDSCKGLLMRELAYLQAPGEAGVPLLLMIATALEVLQEPLEAGKIVVSWAQGLTMTNDPESKNAAPDPYHSLSEVLLYSMGADSALDEEQFAGEVYTVHVAVEWLARRGYREVLEKLWPAITRLHFVEFSPSSQANLLASDDPYGEHRAWAPAAPASWAKLKAEAAVVEESALPVRLWQHLYMLPFLPLLFPQRLTTNVARVLDYMVTQRCEVALTEEVALNEAEE